MPSSYRSKLHLTPRGRFVLAALALLSVACTLALRSAEAPAQSADELQSKLNELENNKARQVQIADSLEEQNRQIDALIGEMSHLIVKQEAVGAELEQRQADYDQATAELNAQREQLVALRAHLKRSISQLETFLVDIYKSGSPDLISVVLQADSWEELATSSQYMDEIRNHDATVVDRVGELRDEVRDLVTKLVGVRERVKEARDQIAARKAELDAARADFEARRADLQAVRDAREAELGALEDREGFLTKELAPSGMGPGGTATLLPNGDALAPADAPLQVKAVIEGANAINDQPYLWGGGHGSFDSYGYDCSGSVSYALHNAGLLETPMDSTGFTAYGDSGPGNWITTYAYSGHMYMIVAGLRFDTGGPGGGNGPRWSTVMRETVGFVARHPSGL